MTQRTLVTGGAGFLGSHLCQRLLDRGEQGEMAMINGRVIQKGEVVVTQNVPNPLRLTDLSGRSVIISAGERRYELTIAPLRH